MLYAYPKLSPMDLGVFRFIGSGLCNLLFPWARAVVTAKEYDLKPIFPTWPQIKMGPILRREKDKRFYHNLFRPPEDNIFGVRKFYLLTTTRKIPESQFLSSQCDVDSREDYVIIFKGMGEKGMRFSPILTRHSLVFKELKKMTLDSHKQGQNYNFKDSISVHIRLGDFSIPKDRNILKNGAHNYRIPFKWYCGQIRKIRDTLSKNLPVYVFSDGTDKELSSILRMEKVKRLTFGSSIADLFALSCSNVLIASGSAFSQWASYLGRMPVIWYPGQLRERLYYENSELEIENEEDGELPDGFFEKVRR